MGMFDKIFGKKKEVISDTIASQVADIAAIILFGDEKVQVDSLFEGLLYSTFLVLGNVEQNRSDDYLQFKDKYFKALGLWAKETEVYKKVKGDLGDFINSRFDLYYNELEEFKKNPNAVFGAKIAYYIFERPLSIDSGIRNHNILDWIFKNGQLIKQLDIMMKEARGESYNKPLENNYRNSREFDEDDWIIK